MPVIDRYLEVIQKQRAEALVFSVGASVEMIVAGQARPVSSKPATMEQIHALLIEILPDYPAQLSSGILTCPYSSSYGDFMLQIAQQADGVSLRILSTPSAPPTFQEQTPRPATVCPGSGTAAANQTCANR